MRSWQRVREVASNMEQWVTQSQENNHKEYFTNTNTLLTYWLIKISGIKFQNKKK